LDKSFAQTLSNFAPTFTDVRPLSVSPDETGLKDPFRITVKTFDGFTYDLLVGKEGPDKARFLQLSVSAELPSARTPAPDESADDKKKKDEEFDKKNAGLKERLAAEKRFEKWVYLVPDWKLEQILKRRDEIVSKASPSPSPAGVPLPELPSALSPGSAISPSPEPVAKPAPESAPSPSPSPSVSPSPTPTPSPSPSSGENPSSTPTPSPSPSPGESPSSTPTPSLSPSPGESPKPTLTPSPTERS
jgi:hypothetical protein